MKKLYLIPILFLLANIYAVTFSESYVAAGFRNTFKETFLFGLFYNSTDLDIYFNMYRHPTFSFGQTLGLLASLSVYLIIALGIPFYIDSKES